MSDSPPVAAEPLPGYTSNAFAKLPVAARAVLCTICVCTGLSLAFGSVYLRRVLSKWGKNRGDDASRPYVPSGLAGILNGAVALCFVVNLLTVTVLASQDEPTLSAVAMLAILIPAIFIGAALGGRWTWFAMLLVAFSGGTSFSLLASLSFHALHKGARLIVLCIVLCLATTLCAILAIQRLHCRGIARRTYLVLSAATGSWLFCLGVDIFAQVGLLDAMSLLTSDTGLTAAGASVEKTIILWNSPKCKALFAGAWLLTAFGSAFQIWRYSIIGNDPDDEWNSYLGTLLKDEKGVIGHTPLLDHGRSGVFSAQQGFFTRIFSSKTPRKASQPAMYKGDMEALPTLDKDEYDGGGGEHVALPRFPGSMASFGSDAKSKPPARYDTLYPGLGLYEDSEEKGGDLAGLGDGGRPLYDPVQYQQRSLAPGLVRNDSEPSFRSIPPYEPRSLGPKEERTPSLSGSTVYNTSVDGDGKSQRNFSGKTDAYTASPDLSASGPLTTVFGIAKTVAFEESGKKSPTLAKVDTRRAAEKRIPSPSLSPGLRTSSPVPMRSSALPYASPVLPSSAENPYEQIAVQATPSLLNAIKRVSAAQKQAKDWRSAQSGLGMGVPDRDQEVLKAAAARRRQSSQAEWWSEVERKAAARSPSADSR